MIRDRFTRLAQCFVHTYRRRKRTFVIANLLSFELKTSSSKSLRDEILDLNVYSISSQQEVFELSVVQSEILYYIDVTSNATWLSKISDDQKKFVLKCDWGVNYLWFEYATCLNVFRQLRNHMMSARAVTNITWQRDKVRWSIYAEE